MYCNLMKFSIMKCDVLQCSAIDCNVLRIIKIKEKIQGFGSVSGQKTCFPVDMGIVEAVLVNFKWFFLFIRPLCNVFSVSTQACFLWTLPLLILNTLCFLETQFLYMRLCLSICLSVFLYLSFSSYCRSLLQSFKHRRHNFHFLS